MRLSLFVLAALSVAASAHPDRTIRSSNGNGTISFDIPYPASTYLAFLANDEDASFTFQVNGLELWKKGEEKSTQKTYGSFERRRWNLMTIWIPQKQKDQPAVNIFPRTTYHMQRDPEKLRKITLWSNKEIYWTQCAAYHSCNFSGSVLNAPEYAATNSATVALAVICGLLVVAVIGLVAYILRVLRKNPSRIKEPETNMGYNMGHDMGQGMAQETIYEDVDLSRNPNNYPMEQADHESVNSIYGATINREE